MRVAVVNLTSGGLSGGYRKYLARLMPLIAADQRITRLTVFVPRAAMVNLDPGVDVRPWSSTRLPGHSHGLAPEVLASRPDVVFVPTARYVHVGATPAVVMVRNMEPLLRPFGGNPWSHSARNVLRAREARRACKRASRVIAVSEHVRDFVVTRWGLDPQRVGVVYHGVDRVPDEALERVAPADSLFTAGSIRPARGLEDVIGALSALDARVRLVIAGRVDPGCDGYAARLQRLAVQRGVADRIAWAGELRPTDMLRAFVSCAVFIMTSRAEACPNIALEAMSCGCASVSVDHAPMPEFFGGAARYYAAGQPGGLADQLRALLADAAERERLGTIARQRAATFTWDRTRDRTIEELQRAIG